MSEVTWFNQSQDSTGKKVLADTDAARIVEALNLQVPDVITQWGQAYGIRHTLGDNPAGPADVAAPAYFLYDADLADGAGYHDVDPQGRPYIRVFVNTILSHGGSTFGDDPAVSGCASHEAVEFAIDPECRLSHIAPNGDTWAVEVADPVEMSLYRVITSDGTDVSVSDFVYPSFFDCSGKPPYSHTGAVTAPFTLSPGGYGIINGKDVWGSQTGPVASGQPRYPEWRWVLLKEQSGSRTARRHVGSSSGRNS